MKKKHLVVVIILLVTILFSFQPIWKYFKEKELPLEQYDFDLYPINKIIIARFSNLDGYYNKIFFSSKNGRTMGYLSFGEKPDERIVKIKAINFESSKAFVTFELENKEEEVIKIDL